MIVVDVERRKIAEKPSLGLPITDGISELLQHRDPHSPSTPLLMGGGPYTAYESMGANRAVGVFLSPLTGGVFVTSAGGVGRAFAALGDSVLIKGRSPTPVVLVLVGYKSDTELRVYDVDGVEDFDSTFEFHDFLYDELKDLYSGYFRIGVVGKAAFTTWYGSLLFPERGMNTFDLMGRGGIGSVLARVHNVVAIAIGGELEREEDPGFSELMEEAGMSVITKKTEKYRLVVKEGIGGTIYNWAKLKSLLPMLNWNTIYMNEREREELFEDYVKEMVEWLRKGFKSFIRSTTCGEKCVAVCKKMKDGKKIEYEPLTAIGLQTGVFDIELAMNLVHRADELGFDAIEVGNVISLHIDASDEGLVESKASLVEVDPERNFEAASTLLEEIAKDGKRFEYGVKGYARHLGAEKLAVYINTRKGGIAPPQYWVPGFFVPLPLIGKFMTYYGMDYREPHELGRTAGERFMKEYLMENLGICRFHRGWVEPVLDKLLEKLGVDRELIVNDTILMIKVLNGVLGGYVIRPEGRALDVIRTHARLYGKEVDGEKWFREVKEGVDEVLPLLTSPSLFPAS